MDDSSQVKPLGFAKFLSWSALVLILVSSLFMSIVIANFARETLLTKQREFALLLATNLNHQIYRRFILPTIIGFGRIALKQEAQYERLDQVITSTIHGLHVQELRIYDYDHIVSYSSNRELVGQEGLAGAAAIKALDKAEPSFEMISRLSPLEAMFAFQAEPGSVVLKTTYPLRTEEGLGIEEGEVIIGALEITQDITGDYQTVVNFQWLIIGTSFGISLILFLVMLLIIRRADRIQAERVAEKARLERELHQSEKMASMGRTVAGIAHEIRNPLGIIRSTAELLLKKGAADDPNARFLKAIHDEAKRLSQTVNDFLDYARPRSPVLEPVNVSDVLDQILVFLDGECAKRVVTVEKRYVPGLVIQGDKDLLYRAFYNVLINALQAMQAGGRIIVETEMGKEHLVVSFLDSGPGFDAAVRDRVAEPFFTTKDHGTGLGLAIVSSIVSSHRGELHLGNGPAGGALVRIRLPRAVQPSGAQP